MKKLRYLIIASVIVSGIISACTSYTNTLENTKWQCIQINVDSLGVRTQDTMEYSFSSSSSGIYRFSGSLFSNEQLKLVDSTFTRPVGYSYKEKNNAITITNDGSVYRGTVTGAIMTLIPDYQPNSTPIIFNKE